MEPAPSRPIARRPELTEELKKEVRDVFELFDSGANGHVEKRKLKVMMRVLGYEPRKEQLARMLVKCGISQRQTQIKYEEFFNIMSLMMNERDIQEEMMRAFSLFDVDGTGKISLDNLKNVAQQLGEKMTDTELKEMIGEADMNGDGTVNATEFIRIMNKTELWSIN